MSRRTQCVMIEALEQRLLLSAATVPANLAITTNPQAQQYPSIATDPLNPSHLVVSYMDQSSVNTGFEGIGVAVSEDGGATWKTTSIALPANFSQGAADPTTVFDGKGGVYVSFMSATFLGPQPELTNPIAQERPDGFQANNGIFVARSDDGGFTWGLAVAVASQKYDGSDPVPFNTFPDLAIDTSRLLPGGQLNPNYGNEYETWTTLYPSGQFPDDPTSSGGGTIMLAVSSNGGKTWQLRTTQPAGGGSPVTVIGPNDPFFTGEAPPGLTGQNYAQVTVGPQGNVYVSYYMFGYFAVIYSTDAGENFDSIDLQTNLGVPFNVIPQYLADISSSTSDGGPTGAGGANNTFRTLPVRDIIADPSRPGTLYVADAVYTPNSEGVALDYGDVFFAVSTDDGQNWSSINPSNPNDPRILNDDNGGLPTTGSTQDVVTNQAMPEMAIDAQGDLAVIWYDTRRDPQGNLLDVFGTISTDGGVTFSPNFRITNTSFDSNVGQFDDFLGDRIGVSISQGVVDATWTDTRDGNQNIEFAKLSISSLPPTSDDRFGPNNTPATATVIGPVIDTFEPKLEVAAGDEEWFSVTASVTGDLTVTASGNVSLNFYSADGDTLLASSGVQGQPLVYSAEAGKSYLVEVLPGGDSASSYTLTVQSLTGDFGTAVVGNAAGDLASGDVDDYLLQPGAAGSFVAVLTPGDDEEGTLDFEVLDPTASLANGKTALLASASPGNGSTEVLTLPVTQGEPLLLRVSAEAGASGHFKFNFTNLDLFATGLGSATPIPAGNGPSQIVIADVNHDGKPDMIVSDALDNTVSVLLNNGNGTFQAPLEYEIGAMNPGGTDSLNNVPQFQRGLVVADLTGNGSEDIVVTNPASGDVSVLLGRGNGTFEPQRRFDAGPSPDAITTGDFNGDGVPDLAVISTSQAYSTVVILLGRGDGSFYTTPSGTFVTPVVNSLGADNITAAYLNGQSEPEDLIVTGSAGGDYIYTGDGRGDFTYSTSVYGSGPGQLVADLEGDGPDIVNASFFNDSVSIVPVNGDGTFGSPSVYTVGQTPLGLAVGDVGSPVPVDSDGDYSTTQLGPPDGHLDIIIADSGSPQLSSVGPAQIVVLPSIYDGNEFEGFANPVTIASGIIPDSLAVGDLTGNGATDIAYVDTDGVHIIYGSPTPVIVPNDTLQTARNLGVVVHLAEPTLSIVPGYQDAYYQMTVPTEAAQGAGEEVIDFSADFTATAGAGLTMQVLNSDGTILGSGQHFQVLAEQGEVLKVVVSGAKGQSGTPGSGAYTLDIDVLPQVASVQSESPLPGQGEPASTLVITFQGDRLDPATAQDPANYIVAYLGRHGVSGAAIEQIVPTDVVYDPSANVDVTTGITYPTAVQQTVTLLFAQSLPTGSYRITVKSSVDSESLSDDESSILIGDSLVGHPVASIVNGHVVAAAQLNIANLVRRSAEVGSFNAFPSGTPFLSQLDADLSAVLDANLTGSGDQPQIQTENLIDQILRRLRPSLSSAANAAPPFLVVFLDPVSLDLADPAGQRINYSLQSGQLKNQISNAYVSVANNVEVVVLPIESGQYNLQLSEVSPASRGGVVIVGADIQQSQSLTGAIRTGTQDFQFGIQVVAEFFTELVLNTPEAIISPAQGLDSALLTSPPVDLLQGLSTSNAAPSSSTLEELTLLFIASQRRKTFAGIYDNSPVIQPISRPAPSAAPVASTAHAAPPPVAPAPSPPPAAQAPVPPPPQPTPTTKPVKGVSGNKADTNSQQDQPQQAAPRASANPKDDAPDKKGSSALPIDLKNPGHAWKSALQTCVGQLFPATLLCSGNFLRRRRGGRGQPKRRRRRI